MLKHLERQIHVDISQLRDIQPIHCHQNTRQTTQPMQRTWTTKRHASIEIIKIEIVFQTEIIWNDLKW